MSVISGANSEESVEENEIDPTIAEQFNMPLAFQKPWHTEKIVSGSSVAPTWRMKERVSGINKLISFLC